MESPAGHVRVAIIVPRHGHTAVRRNKLKRQLRELTIERHDEATYFGLPDDVEFCDNFDAEKAARVDA